MAKTSLKDILRKIVDLNEEGFGEADPYSSLERLCHFMLLDDGDYILHRVQGEVVAYLLYRKKNKFFECVRMAVTEDHSGKGIATKLHKRAIALAKSSGAKYKTYASKDNLASINALLGSGMKVTAINDWVYVESR